MNAEPWYVELFRRDYYRAWVPRIDPTVTAGQVEFLAEALALATGDRLLDLACGHGRHAVPLAGRGYAVTGLDLSAYHLRLARKAAREAGVRVRWLQRDMRDIPFAGEFDAAINMFTAFGYLESDEEDARVLESVSRALKPRGRFLIDTMNREWLVRNFREADWHEHADGRITLERRKLDLLAGRIETVWTIVTPSGRRRSHPLVLRLYTLAELANILERAGLAVRQTWGDFEGQEYGLDSPRMIVLAQKTSGQPAGLPEGSIATQLQTFRSAGCGAGLKPCRYEAWSRITSRPPDLSGGLPRLLACPASGPIRRRITRSMGAQASFSTSRTAALAFPGVPTQGSLRHPPGAPRTAHEASSRGYHLQS